MTILINKTYVALHEKIGINANKASATWNVGFHQFDDSLGRTYRVVLRSKKGRWYSQITVPHKDTVRICYDRQTRTNDIR